MSAIQPAIRSALQPAIRSAILSYGAVAWSPLTLFAASEVGVWYDPSDFSTMFQDSAGTTPVTAIGDPVGKILDKSGNGKHASQATATSRPRLGRTPVGGQRNLLLATDTLSTQNYTTTAVAHTLSFTGTGTVTLSGTSTAGPLVGTGVSDRVSLTFTPTAGTLTLTVSGSVTFAQLEIGSTATAYQKVVQAYDVTESGKADCYCLYFDGTDDSLATAAIDFSATDKITHHAGWTQSTASFGMVTELSNNPGPNAGMFSLAAYTVGEMFFVAKGTAVLTARFDAATLPKTRVSTGLLDIAQALAADEIVARVNGVVKPVLSYLDAGPAGTGNFGNYPLYLGRRGGIQYPFSGRIYSIVIRGALSDAAQIAAAESYVAGKTGLSI